MFTGLVDHCGEVVRLEDGRITIRTEFSSLVEGESISVDGACLTVVEPNQGVFDAIVSPETFERTVVGHYRPGTRVNLERAMAAGDRFGGHWVTGHIDSKVQVLSVEEQEDCWNVALSLDEESRALVLEKGSVSLNGISLTVNAVEPDRFWIMAIPHTRSITNLSQWQVGTALNVEWDWMGKVVIQQVERLWASREENQ